MKQFKVRAFPLLVLLILLALSLLSLRSLADGDQNNSLTGQSTNASDQVGIKRSRQRPLPNFDSGPGLPAPIGINFYEILPQHPEYLVCTYDVSEVHYDSENEPAWFEASLLQIRGSGAQRFPQIKWVAVCIKNRAEHKDEATFKKSYKAGAVFQADQVFDISSRVKDLVAHEQVDRNPIDYNLGSLSVQWSFVERHAATNHVATGAEHP
jgi:hypothetical protein